MSVNIKMKAIADEIRELSGTTEAMGLDAMASTLNAENTNFASNLTTQDNLIFQIQTALQNKAAATGEDVTAETTAYTNKLATLETAITALETELQGKASGGSGGGSVGWINVTSLPSTYIVEPDLVSIYYYEAPENCIGAACVGTGNENAKNGSVIIACTKKSGSFDTVKSGSSTLLKLSDADGTGTIVKIETGYPYTYFLPILSSELS